MNFKNYMEDVVVEVYEDFKIKNPVFCHCERCRKDTSAIALNQLKAKYVATFEGEIFAKLSREERQVKADALIALIDAAKMVAENPRH